MIQNMPINWQHLNYLEKFLKIFKLIHFMKLVYIPNIILILNY